MLRLAYLTHSNITIFETFIYEFVDGLNKELDLDLTFISCRKFIKNKLPILKTMSTGFSNKFDISGYRSNQLGQVLGVMVSIKNVVNKLIAEKQLRFINSADYDVSRVDYATLGISMRRLLKKERIPTIGHHTKIIAVKKMPTGLGHYTATIYCGWINRIL